MTEQEAGPGSVESVILSLLAGRRPGATICPSEVARVAADRDGFEDWRPLMEAVRAAARRLAAQDRLEITQRGRPVDLSQAKGPIRLGLPKGARRRAVQPWSSTRRTVNR